MNHYAQEHDNATFVDGFAIDATLASRMGFIRRTYAHVFGAILAFMMLEFLFFSVEPIKVTLLTLIGGNWWLALIAFMVVSWVAGRWAESGATPAKQYLGLGVFVFCEALIFVPLLWIANGYSSDVIPTAAFLTLVLFGGLTFVVFVTRQDFSFLSTAIWVGSIAALGIIAASWLMGFSLGLLFISFMVVLMCGSILYQTSNVLHHYRTDQHVAASLALFASVATLFWYMIRLVMVFGDD